MITIQAFEPAMCRGSGVCGVDIPRSTNRRLAFARPAIAIAPGSTRKTLAQLTSWYA